MQYLILPEGDLMRNKQRGFTLVELSIVMVIIALLAGSIFAGQAIIDASKIKSTVSQIEEFQSGFNVFVDKFSAYPGDFSRAERFLGAPATMIGNGDSHTVWADVQVGGTAGSEPAEGPLAWYHMKLAGLVSGQYGNDPQWMIDANAIPGTVVPYAKIGADGGGFYMNYDSTVQEMGNHLGLGHYDATTLGMNNHPLLTGKQAFDIDKKLDDSFPRTGLVRGNEDDPVGTPGGDCYDVGTQEYFLTLESIGCSITYKLD